MGRDTNSKHTTNTSKKEKQQWKQQEEEKKKIQNSNVNHSSYAKIYERNKFSKKHFLLS